MKKQKKTKTKKDVIEIGESKDEELKKWQKEQSRDFNVHPLVENMVKKKHSRFPIAVVLTTLICSH